jgi:hypothetical protein
MCVQIYISHRQSGPQDELALQEYVQRDRKRGEAHGPVVVQGSRGGLHCVSETH